MKVFVSYHHDDVMFAKLVEANLRAHNIEAWLAANIQGGASWGTEIDDAIHGASAVLVLLSPLTRGSEYVTYEWAYAMGRGKPVIPILQAQAPQHPKLAGLHYLDFSGRNTQPWADLVELLARLPLAVPAPTRMAYQAEEVQRVREASTYVPAPPAKRGRSPSKQVRDLFIVVDIQKDFFRGGALAAADAESLLGPLNKAMAIAQERGIKAVFTRDWHPVNHSSFISEGGAWPTHCCQGTPGAAFHEALIIPPECATISIGTSAERPGYSPYEDEEMDRIVNRREVGCVYVAGVALEYCVQRTCLDTRLRGKRVILCSRLVRAATEDPVRIAEIHRSLEENGVEISMDLVPFEGNTSEAAAREAL